MILVYLVSVYIITLFAAVNALATNLFADDTSVDCGNTHSCFQVSSGVVGGDEPKMVAFKNSSNNNDTIDFVVRGVRPSWVTNNFPLEADNWALAVGFSKTPAMPNSAIIACIYDGVHSSPTPSSYIVGAYATYRKAPPENDELTALIQNGSLSMQNDTMICTFTLPTLFTVNNETFDLSTAAGHHILLARLYASRRCLGYHNEDKAISQATALANAVPVDLDAAYVGHGPVVVDHAHNIEVNGSSSTVDNFTKLSDVIGACGHEGQCVSLPRDCHLKDNGSRVDAECDLLAVYSVADTNSGVEFTLFGRKPNELAAHPGWYMAVGLSPTTNMDHSILIACVDDGHGTPSLVTAYGYVNGHPELQPSAMSNLLAEQHIQAGPTLLICQFTTLGMSLTMGSVAANQTVTIDMQNESLHVLMARGAFSDGDIQYHGPKPNRMHTSAKQNITEF